MSKKRDRYSRRSIINRIKRDIRHDERAIQERSKTLIGFEFIENFEVYYFSGEANEPKSEYAVYFNLKYPILVQHFREFLDNKLRGAIIE